MNKLILVLSFIFFNTSAFLTYTEVANSDMDNIYDSIVSLDAFSILNEAIEVAEMSQTLSDVGPITFFAPLNPAFQELSENTLASLLIPESMAVMNLLLSYHIVEGVLLTSDLIQLIENNSGSYALTTLQGLKLVATIVDGNVSLTDTEGNVSQIVYPNQEASNGVFHGIDRLLRPRK